MTKTSPKAPRTVTGKTPARTSAPVELVAIAKLIAPFGIKGYLKVQLHTHSPERLVDLQSAFIGRNAAEVQEVGIVDVQFHHKGCVLKLVTTPDRTAAERMVGNFLFVPAAARAKLPRGEFYVDDVIGCTVTTVEGLVIGKIQDVLKYPAQDVWSIDYRGKIVMIPVVKEFIKQVDVKKQIVVVQGIEGFLEL